MKTFFYFAFTAMMITNIFAQSLEKCYTQEQPKLSKQAIERHTSAFSLNDFYNPVSNNGEFNQKGYDSFFYFPATTKKGASFSSSFIFIGNHHGPLKGSGSIYSKSTLKPGKILQITKADDPALLTNRVYRVRPDYKTNPFINEIANGEGTVQQTYNQYDKDWLEWPASSGAPFDDKNKNGIYEPAIDIPGVPGSHQTLWYVSNDLEGNDNPMSGMISFGGVETQVTVWGYEGDEKLKNTVFKKVKLINKTGSDITDTYLGLFGDPGVNESDSFFAGCDSTIGLAYAYSSKEFDLTFGTRPRAYGLKYLQGPTVTASANDFAFVNGKKIFGKKNLSATSFVFYTCGGNYIPWPKQGINWYNNLKGKTYSGGDFYAPSTGGAAVKTNFVFAGDPVSKQGWYEDGSTQSCGQRYILLGSGPFNIAKADTQEFVFAEIIGVGVNNLDAITNLKERSAQTQNIYNNFVIPNKVTASRINGFTQSAIKLTEDQNSMTLTWGLDEAQVYQIEKQVVNGYTFQGYKVYQMFDGLPAKDFGKVIAVYDVNDGIRDVGELVYNNSGFLSEKVEHKGTDNSVSYSHTFTKDFDGSNFIKGKNYIFGISAYYVSKSNFGILEIYPRRSIETPITYASIVYRKNEAGINYLDRITVQSNNPMLFGSYDILVADPAKLNDHTYQINFSKENDLTYWNLSDKTINKTLLTKQALVYNLPSVNKYVDIDGYKIALYKVNPGFREDGTGIVEVAYGGKALTPKEFDESGKFFNGNNVWNDLNYAGINNERDKYFLYNDLDRYIWGLPSKFFDYEIRFTNEGSYALTRDKYIAKVPFEIWRIGINTITDTKDDFRLIPLIAEYGSAYNWNNGIWGAIKSTDGKYQMSYRIRALQPSDLQSTVSEYDAFKIYCDKTGVGNRYFGTVSIDKNEISAFNFVDADNDKLPPPPGTVIRLITKKEFQVGDILEFNKFNFTDVANQELPTEFKLEQNYPNPFNPTTTIRFSVPVVDANFASTTHVTLKVYDILGREVATLVDELKQPGEYNVEFNVETRYGASLPSGVYFYRLTAGSYSETKKMVLIK